MSYLFASNRKRKSGNNLLAVFVILLISVTLFFSSSFIYSILSPLWIAEDRVLDLASKDRLFSSKTDLIRRVDELEQENNKLRLELLSSIAKSQEYDQLLGLGIDHDQKGVVAKVVRRPPFSPFDSLVIDRGVSQDVVVGDRVFYNDLYVGTISKVFENNSVVSLHTSPGSIQNVVFTNSGKEVQAEGVGNGSFVISIPTSMEVGIGETIEGLDRNLSVVATVKYIDSQSGQTLKKVFAGVPWDVEDISWVTIRK